MPNKTLEKWEEKTLGEIIYSISNGTSIKQVKNKTDFPVTRIETISNCSINYEKVGYIENCDDELKEKYQMIEGDILFSNINSDIHLGKTAIFENSQEFLLHGMNLLNIRVNQEIIIPKFLNYYFIYSRFLGRFIKMASRSVNQSSINQTKLKSFLVCVPPLQEQQRIVKILDKAFENIEKSKQNALQNLNNAKELFESYLTSILVNKDNWDKKKLSEVAIDFGRGRSRHRPRNDKKLYGGEYPFIQTGDIRNSNHFITEYSQTYNEIGLAQSKLWPKGTLCITIAANIAETGVLTFDACFPDSVIGCVFDETKTNIDYVEYLLQSFKAILQAEGKGSAQDNINLGTFEKHYFPFPNKAKQDEIVDNLNCMRTNIAKLEQIYEQKIKDLDELKQSILQKAFNGEL